MVVATNGTASGASEKVAKVIKPLMVASTLPRVLRPGETFNVLSMYGRQKIIFAMYLFLSKTFKA
jgi:hypothetical protein